MELKTIIQSANHMLVRLDNSFKEEQKTRQQLYDAMAVQRKAELMAYRSQINPHFLFNTMECIRSLAHNGATEQVETMISSMAQIFRYSLYSTTMSTLGQEIHHVENYFNVMNIRYCGKFKIKIIADEQARNFPILSMILQPIVENSLKYAFEEKNENCLVTILAKVLEDGSLTVKICDNGCGLTGEELTKLKEKIYSKNSQKDSSNGSIGLQNINRRLCLTFGGSFHMKILSQVGYYTVVELHIPFFNGLKKIKTKLDSKRENSSLLIDLQDKTEVLEVAKKLSAWPLKNYHCVIVSGETEDLSFEKEVVCYPLEIKHFPKKAYVCSSNNVLKETTKFYSSLCHREIEELGEMIQEAIFAFRGNFKYSSNQIVSRMQVYLSENYSTNISLKHLSAIFFLSETYLCDIFKKETQDTIFNFIKKLRIHNACYLMKYSNLSLKEISIAVGFNDYSYFGRAFKQITQESPAAYKGKFDKSFLN